MTSKHVGRKGFLILLVAAACGCGASKGGAPDAPAGDNASGSAEQGSEPGASDAPGAAIQARAPAPKTRALESRSITMDFELTLLRGEAPAGIQSGNWSLEEERSLEVVESKGNAVTKLMLTYGRRETKPLLGIERTAATAGKSYVVQPGASIARSDGGKPSSEEHSAVVAEYGWVGEPSPLIALLSSSSLKPGAELDPNADAKRAVIGEISGIDPAATRLTLRFEGLRGEGRKQALLAASGLATLENGDITFELELEGPVAVDVETGFVASAELAGKVKAKGKVKHKKGPLEAHGKGSVRLVRKAQF